MIDMRKIPTVFRRDPDDMRRVTREVHPDCQWVVDGEGLPTRKYDGTCVMFDGERWWARREVKPGKEPPPNFQPVETDPATDKTVGWEPVEQSAFAKFHAEAVVNTDEADGGAEPWAPGTYELVGPKVNGNPEKAERHELWAHAVAEVEPAAPRDFDGLAKFLAGFPGEGLVWHHPDGRMLQAEAARLRGRGAAVTGDLDYLSDADGLPWQNIPGTDLYRRPAGTGEPDVALPLSYLSAEFGGLHAVPDGPDPWKD